MTADREKRDLVERACLAMEKDLKVFLGGVLRDSHRAEDALQRTVVKAIEAAESVNPGTIRGWLFRIALNEAREMKRGMARQGRLLQKIQDLVQQSSDPDSDDGFRKALSEEQKDCIDRALNQLSPDYREVVIRRIQHNQTFATIAEDLNKPLGTVLTWMRRALIELRENDELKDFRDNV